jgi:chromosome segregation ATPase
MAAPRSCKTSLSPTCAPTAALLQRAAATKEATEALVSAQTEREMEKLRREVKKEAAKCKEFSDKCDSLQIETRENRAELRAATQRMEDAKARAKEQVRPTDRPSAHFAL